MCAYLLTLPLPVPLACVCIFRDRERWEWGRGRRRGREGEETGGKGKIENRVCCCRPAGPLHPAAGRSSEFEDLAAAPPPALPPPLSTVELHAYMRATSTLYRHRSFFRSFVRRAAMITDRGGSGCCWCCGDNDGVKKHLSCALRTRVYSVYLCSTNSTTIGSFGEVIEPQIIFNMAVAHYFLRSTIAFYLLPSFKNRNKCCMFFFVSILLKLLQLLI